ncbi:MAG: hypothetical protein R3C59_27920 [Planctomycetaceae bacterium]
MRQFAVNNKPYSATVQLTLHVAGQDYELAKVGPDRVSLRKPIDLPPCEGMLSINIDGNITQHTVRLPEGASAESPSVMTRR